MTEQTFISPRMPTQVAIVAQQQAASTDPRHRNKNILRGLGIAEIVIGSLSFLLAATTMIMVPEEARNYINSYGLVYVSYGFTYCAQGIWCGILAIICGILGVRVRSTPNRCMYVANMTMTIITANITFAGFVLSAIAAVASGFSSGLTGIHSIITVLIFAVFVLNIIHSSFCCSGVCYSKPYIAAQPYVPYPQQNIAVQQPQYIYGPAGQVMMVSNQPMMTNVTTQSYPQMMTGTTAYPQESSIAIKQPQMGHVAHQLNEPYAGTTAATQPSIERPPSYR